MRHCEDCGVLSDCTELVLRDVETDEVLLDDYWLCADCWETL